MEQLYLVASDKATVMFEVDEDTDKNRYLHCFPSGKLKSDTRPRSGRSLLDLRRLKTAKDQGLTRRSGIGVVLIRRRGLVVSGGSPLAAAVVRLLVGPTRARALRRRVSAGRVMAEFVASVLERTKWILLGRFKAI